MGAHQHQASEGLPIGVAATQGRQAGGVEGLGRQGGQGREQAGGRLEQKPPRPGGRSHDLIHRGSKGGQLGRPLAINHHPGVACEIRQPAHQGLKTSALGPIPFRHGRLELAAVNALHGLGRDRSGRFLRHPGRQKAGAVAEEPVLGEGTAVHRFAVQQVHSCRRGPAAAQEGGHQKTGGEGAQLGSDHLALQGEMAPQGRIAATHHQPAVDPAGGDGLDQQGLERAAEGRQPGAGLLGRQVAGIDQQEQQGRRIGQALAQAGGVPAQQQRAAVHRLGAGGIVVKHDDLEGARLGGPGFRGLSHGTIVP